MITRRLLRNERHRAMTTTVRSLFAKIIPISPSCWTNLLFVWNYSQNGNCPLDWTSIPMFCTNQLLQKTLNLIWILFTK